MVSRLRGRLIKWTAVGLALVQSVAPLDAIDADNFAVQASARVQAVPPQVRLEWVPGNLATGYQVSRKLVHEQAWRPLASLPGHATSYTDSTVVSGAAYEYEIIQSSADGLAAYGYVYAGIENPFPNSRGRVVLVVDETHAASLAGELARLNTDLTGDGWTVLRHDVPRTAPPANVKSLIRAAYQSDPNNTKAVFLFGHVPVPYSGNVNPDLHRGHMGAWPADVYYGEMEGSWTDHSVQNTSAEDPRNHNVPGDGKFDQSLIPGRVVLQVGRVDFADLPAFAPRTERDLLRQYLDKNHQFRHKLINVERRGLIRDNFGEIEGDAPATDAWRAFAPFFGPDGITVAGSGDFFPTLARETYLWVYGGGGGGYYQADSVGSTSDFARESPGAVFFMLHGSYFGDWDSTDNFLRAALASSGNGLAAAWTGLPHWFLHHMGLGETIGFSTMVAQNNRGLYKNQVNLSAGEVHIALMGDPTLRMHTVAPPRNLSAVLVDDGAVVLNWTASADSIQGYYVYRGATADGPFSRLTRTFLASTSYTDPTAPAGPKTYLVRAVKLETTASGTYYNPSQAAFATAVPNGALPIVRIEAGNETAAESGPAAGSFVVTRSPSSGSPLQVEVAISGSASNGVDYEAISGSVTIPGDASAVWITIRPLADDLVEGDETVTLTLLPGGGYAVGFPQTATVVIQDRSVNQPPAISPVADQFILVNRSSQLSFTITDLDSPLSSLSISATSSNPVLLPDASLIVSGTGGTRTLQLSPAPNQTGSATIRLTVSDGAASSSWSFEVTVVPAAVPRISAITRQPDASVLMEFEGAAGTYYTVESSADLQNWTALHSGSFGPTNRTNFVDAQSNGDHRFYRVQSE